MVVPQYVGPYEGPLGHRVSGLSGDGKVFRIPMLVTCDFSPKSGSFDQWFFCFGSIPKKKTKRAIV